jgi:hypothetical protein
MAMDDPAAMHHPDQNAPCATQPDGPEKRTEKTATD